MANLLVNLKDKFQLVQSTKSYIYKDIKAFGGINTKTMDSNLDWNAIRGSIRNILEFRKGQRPLDPEFGNPLYGFLYENITDSTSTNIIASVKNALLNYEPRIYVRSVTVEAEPDERDRNELRVNVVYSLPTLPNYEQLFSMKVTV